MISLIFSAIALSAALTATLVRGMRRAILSLWITGLAMGCLFLTMGAEALAILQWIISTLVAISLIFFAVMFGEYEQDEKQTISLSSIRKFDRRNVVLMVIAILFGAAFSAIIYLGAGELSGNAIPAPSQGNDLTSLGKILVENHMLSLEVLALTLFLVLVGGGVVARPESDPNETASGASNSGGKPC
jgi:NADH:ubiquinone oxidoreductase subunit 6 (subunit J)